MKKKELSTAIGIVNLEHIEFGEMLIDLFFEIRSLPDDIQEKISRDMEVAKAEQLRKLKEYYTDSEIFWSAKGGDTGTLLHISISNYGIASWIEADVADKENDMLWACASVKVDLSGCMEELRTFIVRAVIEKIDAIKYENC